MKALFILVVAALSLPNSQVSAQRYRILYTSEDLNKSNSQDSVKYISVNEMLGVYKVIYKDGHKRKLNPKTVWGYTDDKNHVYRFYEGKVFKVTSIDAVVTYQREEQRYVSKPVYVGNFTAKYKSEGLDGMIVSN